MFRLIVAVFIGVFLNDLLWFFIFLFLKLIGGGYATTY